MGTTLTGTTPQDTYDSLIKVTDNGPLSGTAKYLSDGLGNDSVLALSTSRVGIGTASPSSRLHISGASSALQITDTNKLTNNSFHISAISQTAWGIGTDTSGTFSGTKLAITDAGNVGIGTASPANYGGTTLTVSSPLTNNVGAVVLQNSDGSVRGHIYSSGSANLITIGSATASSVQFVVSDTERMRLTANGLTFNGDTAAANALDDYEEGDWTPAVTFGGGSTGVTYQSRSGKYTKIGRQVSVTGYILLTNKGTDTGVAAVIGLPFAIGNAVGFYSSPNLGALSAITFSGIPSAYGVIGESRVEFVDTVTTGNQSTITNSNFTNSTQIIVQFTYFV